jgi:hypothetical protein
LGNEAPPSKGVSEVRPSESFTSSEITNHAIPYSLHQDDGVT